MIVSLSKDLGKSCVTQGQKRRMPTKSNGRRNRGGRRWGVRRRGQTYTSFIESARFFCITGSTTILYAGSLQVLKEIRRPFRINSVTIKFMLLPGATAAGAVQARLLDPSTGKGIASSTQMLAGSAERTVIVRRPPSMRFISDDEVSASLPLVAVDGLCYGVSAKIPCIAHLTVEFQRMEEVNDSCVTRPAELLHQDGSLRSNGRIPPLTAEPLDSHVDPIGDLSRSFSLLSLATEERPPSQSLVCPHCCKAGGTWQ